MSHSGPTVGLGRGAFMATKSNPILHETLTSRCELAQPFNEKVKLRLIQLRLVTGGRCPLLNDVPPRWKTIRLLGSHSICKSTHPFASGRMKDAVSTYG